LDKKTLPIVIAVLIIVIFYWQILDYLDIVKRVPPKPDETQVVDTIVQIAQPSETTTEREEMPRVALPEPLADTPEVPRESIDADTVVIRTDKYTVTLSSHGGGPVSIVLNEYAYRDGQPIEMLPQATGVTPEVSFAGGTYLTSSLNYRCNLQAGTYDVTRQPMEIVYTYTAPHGGEIAKTYVFPPHEYHYDLQLSVSHTEAFGFERRYTMFWGTPLGTTEPDPKTDYEAMAAVVMRSGSRLDLDDFEDGQLNQHEDGNATWVGVRAKYFAAVMIPQNREAEAVLARGIKQDRQTPNGEMEVREITAGMDMPFARASNIDDRFTVFVGPLDYTLMSKYKVGLEDMLGIGTTPVIGWIIKPFAIAIIWILPKMHSVLPNYGIVIILFAFLVKVITLPLSLKSFKSMNAMKELQPKIEQLKEKHKKNPQALNKEMMRMYKAHGVNPLSGCLPILPQMPLFFALFSVFRSTILLRDAPFVWFITDLSRGATGITDPYIILVVLMIITQFISQKLTMPTNQQQKALLYLMPLFMGFIFYRFAAGLVLYWTCFSLFSLLDYFLFKRRKSAQVQAA